MTNEEVIGVLVGTVGEEDVEAFNSAKAAVLARMTAGWSEIPPEDGERAKLRCVLVAAGYPTGRTMSDVYHCWWAKGEWVRWPHGFPPTHYMPVQPLPATPSDAAP